ncbi:MAG TPA: amidohydrolase family protein [Ignavibacteria bacterium]|nr:amidohydrolase [Bacteroidota bacterium]HRI86074.1 amidohydrolase family protein [Ignavibacteria bacterium]HRJ99029.1 amidohydrolase family protein [Ignavibacteria bacterium]
MLKQISIFSFRRNFFIAVIILLTSGSGFSQKDDIYDNYEVYDVHYHITNYIQEGNSIEKQLEIMGDKVGRSVLFGIPLQQMWSYGNSGDDAPKYYLDTDAPLYYYSFGDAYIAMEYLSLSEEDKKRFDPMITAFNPADMYAPAHIKRVLQTFPGVFSGIGEFTIHKEFVSSKVAGEVASLLNPALDSIFSLCAETGLVAIFHNDINKPFPKSYTQNYVKEVIDVFRRHPGATLIWAHVGLGRIVRPLNDQVEIIREMLEDPTLSHVYFDISWDEVAKYILRNDSTIQGVADLLNQYPDRFLFGSDNVASPDQETYLNVYYMYEPLWKKLTPETREKVKKGNYKRLFDDARTKVRAWEKANPK